MSQMNSPKYSKCSYYDFWMWFYCDFHIQIYSSHTKLRNATPFLSLEGKGQRSRSGMMLHYEVLYGNCRFVCGNCNKVTFRSWNMSIYYTSENSSGSSTAVAMATKKHIKLDFWNGPPWFLIIIDIKLLKNIGPALCLEMIHFCLILASGPRTKVRTALWLFVVIMISHWHFIAITVIRGSLN